MEQDLNRWQVYAKPKSVNFLDSCGEYLHLRLVFPVPVGTARTLDKDIILRGFRIPAHVREQSFLKDILCK